MGGRTGRFGERIRGAEGQEGAQTAEGVAALQLSLGKLEDGEREGGWFGLIAVAPACCSCTAVAMCPLDRAWRTLGTVALSSFSFAQCL